MFTFCKAGVVCGGSAGVCHSVAGQIMLRRKRADHNKAVKPFVLSLPLRL